MKVRRKLEARRPLADVWADIAANNAEHNAVYGEERDAQTWAEEQLRSSPGWRDLNYAEREAQKRKAYARLEAEGYFRERLREIDARRSALHDEAKVHPDAGTNLMIYLTQAEVLHLDRLCKGHDFDARELAISIIRDWLKRH